MAIFQNLFLARIADVAEDEFPLTEQIRRQSGDVQRYSSSYGNQETSRRRFPVPPSTLLPSCLPSASVSPISSRNSRWGFIRMRRSPGCDSLLHVKFEFYEGKASRASWFEIKISDVWIFYFPSFSYAAYSNSFKHCQDIMELHKYSWCKILFKNSSKNRKYEEKDL